MDKQEIIIPDPLPSQMYELTTKLFETLDEEYQLAIRCYLNKMKYGVSYPRAVEELVKISFTAE